MPRRKLQVSKPSWHPRRTSIRVNRRPGYRTPSITVNPLPPPPRPTIGAKRARQDNTMSATRRTNNQSGTRVTFTQPTKKFKSSLNMPGKWQDSSRHFVNDMIRPGRGRMKKPVRVSKALLGPRQQIIREGAFNFKTTVGQSNHYVIPHMDMCINVDDNATVAEVDRELSQCFYIAGKDKWGASAMSENFVKKQRIYLKNCRQTMRMVNTTNASIKVVIRTIGIKRDTNYLPHDFWDIVARHEDNADNDATTNTGFPPYNNILHYKTPNGAPEGLYGWKRLFYVVNKTTLNLDAAAEHKHHIHIEYSRPVRGTDLYAPSYEKEGTDVQSTVPRPDNDPTGQNKQYLKKYTYFTMITILGPKVQTADLGTQSYAEGQLSVWYTGSASFYNYPLVESSKYFYNTIPITLEAAGLAMDEGDGLEPPAAPQTI